ncbi:MAG: matrixin family metalloprotease, partial [Bacteroidia bacterium]
MNKYSSFLLALTILLAMPLFGQAPLYELSLNHKIQIAPTIIEARVIGKKAFWNASQTLIHTAYTLEVYKVFKGEVLTDKVEIIAEGGRIGYEMHVADPGLKMKIGDVGTFFCQTARVKHKSKSGIEQFMPYGGVQGFVQYDELRGQASDVFHVYDDIERQLYQVVALEVNRAYREYKAYSIIDQRLQSQNRATPTFTSFTPTSVTAGTDSMITIVGNNFDAYDGGTNSLVYFANANDGGGTFIAAADYHIVSWTNTQIEVLVPSGASTGFIGVQNVTSELGFTASNLSVTYNLSNVASGANRFRPKLQDENGTGGYDMIYSTSTANNGVDFSTSSAVAPFNSALSTWNCETLYNAEATGATTASNTVDGLTAPNIIMFDDDVTPLASGTLGVCYSGYRSCDGTTWYIDGFDIVFKRSGTDGINWNFGPAATTGGNYDFETVALHELGHSHGIGHINAAGSVMHFALSNNFDARTLDPTRDVAAGVEVIDDSKPMATC